MENTQTKTNIETTFTNAINVFNTAIDKHANEPLMKPIVTAANKLLDDKKIGVAVYKSAPTKPFDYYTLEFDDSRFQIVSHGKEEPNIAWRVSRSYLEDVVKNADDYIENPMKLDLEWLKDRLGM